MKLITVLTAILLTVSGCAANTAPDFCTSYLIVPTLDCGSEIQQRNVDKNNALHDEVCLLKAARILHV